MRSKFDEQLDLLNKEMIHLGMLCENAIQQTVNALVHCDFDQAKGIFELENAINQKNRDIENICFRLLLQQQPVARDFRTISSALKMVTDMNRIGIQSADIAEIILNGNITFVDDRLPLRAMSESMIHMVTQSVDAFVNRDEVLAKKVIDHDDVVDTYFNKMKEMLILELQKPESQKESVLDLLMIAKYFERISDHAANIAKWVIFSINGNLEKIS